MGNKHDEITNMKVLVNLLNEYRDAYYNKNTSLISDYKYDCLFDKLKELEEKTGTVMSNSPTITVGYEVKSKLTKVQHNHLMLSLDKTKSTEDIKKFLNYRIGIAMLKMDGLTVSLKYIDGNLVSAKTRGDGEVGEDILHNAKVVENIPHKISQLGEVVIDGEIIIPYNIFEEINAELPDDKKYMNPRNLASGSIRQLDNKIAARRGMKFIAWKYVYGNKSNSFKEKLDTLSELGFDVVPYELVLEGSSNDWSKNIERIIRRLKDYAKLKHYPIDGIVFGYNDIDYGESLGMTGHHLKSQIAYKFYDEEYESILMDIDWTMGKTSILTPTAIFKPVEIDGTVVERASLHNISIMNELYPKMWHSGLTVTVYKANQIIPQISKVEHKINCCAKRLEPPKVCPVCGGKTEIVQSNNTKVLMCTNSRCKGKLLGTLSHFVSKNAMNIDGLSEATLQKFIEEGFVESFIDIYELKNGFYEDIVKLDGFGKKSADKLMESIEISKNTILDRFINALSIPLIGRTASKTISKYFDDDYEKFIKAFECGFGFDWTVLEDFGSNMHTAMARYSLDNLDDVKELATYMNFQRPQTVVNSTNLKGMIFVITGNLKIFKNREAAKEKIELLGGKVAGTVSKKTSYLVNNDINSTSSKNKKAKELGVAIITEEELVNLLK